MAFPFLFFLFVLFSVAFWGIAHKLGNIGINGNPPVSQVNADLSSHSVALMKDAIGQSKLHTGPM